MNNTCGNCGEYTDSCTCFESTNKCKKCNLVIPKGKLCMACAQNITEAHIKRQIEFHQGKPISVFVGDLLAKETAELILKYLTPERRFILKSLGKNINRSIDILEIIKRNTNIDYKIIPGTKEFINKQDKPIKVSEIEITIGIQNGTKKIIS